MEFVETTMLGDQPFEVATAFGMKEYYDHYIANDLSVVDVESMREIGVLPASARKVPK